MSEQKIQTVPSENNFALSKVKILKNGGLDVHYEVTEIKGSEAYTTKYHVECTRDIHPDLRALFVELRPIMGRVFNITSFLSMVESDEFKATKKQNQAARDFAGLCLDNIEVRGVSLSGMDENLGCVLTGLFTVSNDQKTAINSPRLRLSSEVFGFEEKLEEIVGEIEREVYAFLFKGKQAEMTLFDGVVEDMDGQSAEGAGFPEMSDSGDTDDSGDDDF